MDKENALADLARGEVGDAFAWWLSQHPITTEDCIELAVRKVFADWLNNNRDDIIDAIAKAVHSEV